MVKFEGLVMDVVVRKPHANRVQTRHLKGSSQKKNNCERAPTLIDVVKQQ